ncbi:MAG: DUF1080 domain-containing protein [Thermomicrobia bacterium]|nr:DUF1080 domain-containing protein [Thermomicrobia bacterium]
MGCAALLAACGGQGQSVPTVDTQATVTAITTGTNATVAAAFGSATAAGSQRGTIVAQIGSLQTTVAGQQVAGTAQADNFAATVTAVITDTSQQATAATQQDQATQSARATLTAPTNTPVATATPSVTATPSATSTPTATATPVPKPVAAGTVLYQSDWSNGNGGWATPKGWKIFNGTLVNDGTGGGQSLPAPYQTSRTDYAIEADIEIVRIPNSLCADFGLYARGSYWAGFYAYNECRAFINAGNDAIAVKGFKPKAERQTYRLEVQGNTIRFLINGGLVLETNDNRYLSAGELGMSCDQTQIIVHSFRVIAL